MKLSYGKIKNNIPILYSLAKGKRLGIFLKTCQQRVHLKSNEELIVEYKGVVVGTFKTYVFVNE